MEATEIRNEEEAQKKKRPYQRSPVHYPYYNQTDCIAVSHAIHHRGGGSASMDQLAAYLEYKSAANGAFRSKLAAARQFGLVTGEDPMQITFLAQRILMPENPQQAEQGLVDAFLSVPLFKTVYETYRGQELPEGLGLSNAMRNRFKVAPSGVDTAIATLLQSAETAGFFKARGGNRTQLIIPQIGKGTPSSSQVNPPPPGIGGGGGGDGGGNNGDGKNPPKVEQQRTTADLRNDYVAALIDVLREQGKQGTPDKDLMARIEKLLELETT